MSEIFITNIYEPEELKSLYVPDSFIVPETKYESYQKRKNALTLALTGTSITKAAKNEGVCTKTLKHMLMSFHNLAPDGNPYYFRVCVPNFKYTSILESGNSTDVPDIARPNSFIKLLNARPRIKELVNSFTRPLAKGRPPKSFETLHKKMVKELTQDNLCGFYPLNTKDKGRRALLRYLQKRNIQNVIHSPGDSVEMSGKNTVHCLIYSSLKYLIASKLMRIKLTLRQKLLLTCQMVARS